MAKRYPKPVPKIIADAIYDREDYERAFSKEQRAAMRRAGLRPLTMTDTGNEPLHYDGAAILETMRRIAKQVQGELAEDPPPHSSVAGIDPSGGDEL